MTLTTVGYGDTYPFTPAGKYVAMWVAIWGSFMISIAVVTTMNFFEPEGVNKKAMKEIKQAHSAALTISYAAKFFLAKKRLYIEKIKQDSRIIS